MSVTDVCRLCLTKDNLVWIFDKRFESSESMKDVIYITTGVEIHIKDIVSQKICSKCCQVTIKMFEFRRTSLKNDQHLREECRKYLKENSIKIPNTDVIIKSDIKRKHDEVKSESKAETPKPVFKIHPSVRDLFRVYPQIKLPTVCLSSHITPFVSMPMDDVENYFKVRKLDFNLHTKLALKCGRKVATKKTSAAAKAVNSTSSNPTTTKIVSSKNESKDNVIGPMRNKMSISDFILKSSDKVNYKAHDSASHNKTKDVASKSGVKITHIDLTKPKSSKDITPENNSANRKRKHSETEEVSQQHLHKKPNLIESLGLTPKSINSTSTFTESPSLSYVVNTSVPLHICSMCNSVQYSAKDLRRHQNKHLRCQFCKTKFRTLETKTKHIENTCIIKNMMKNLPDVQLDKIEYNVKVRRKYPECFVNFAPLKNTSDDKEMSAHIKNTKETTSSDISRASPVDKIKPRSDIKNTKETTSKDISRASPVDKSKPSSNVKNIKETTGKDINRASPVDKIKASSNVKNMEEITRKDTSRASPVDTTKPSSNVKNIEKANRKDSNRPSASGKIKTNKDISRGSASGRIKPEFATQKPIIDTGEIIEILSDDDDAPSTSANVTVVDNSIAKAVTNQGKSKTKSDVKAPTSNPSTSKSSSAVPNTLAPIPENIVYNTVSIVKPDIKIKNSNLLESIESLEPKLTDVKILKELLKTKPLQLFAEKRTQTELPTNESICVNRSDLTGELKNLKQQLYVYKIPIVIKNGNYNVTYNYHTDVKPPKKLCLWNDLTPIDIKSVRVTNSAPNIERQVTNEKSNNKKTGHGSSSTTDYSYILDKAERSNYETRVISKKNNIQGSLSVLPSTANNFPVVQNLVPQVSERPRNEAQVVNDKSIQGINSPSILPSTANNFPVVQNLVPQVTERPRNEAQVVNDKSIQETNSPSMLPSTANNFPGVQNVVPQVTERPKNQTQAVSTIQGINSPSILPSTTTCNFPGVQSVVPQITERLRNETRVVSDTGIIQGINSPSTLSSTAACNFPRVQSVVPQVTERFRNETQVVSDTGTIQGVNSPSILPSTATYNFPGVQSFVPQATERSTNETQVVSENIQGTNNSSLLPATASRFVCVNTSSANSTFNAPPSTTSIIDMNPMLNNILEPENTTSCTTETTTSCTTETTTSQPIPASPIVGKPVTNTPIPLGLIRVKDVWELS